MKQRILPVVALLFVAVLFRGNIFAQTLTNGHWTYTLNGSNEATITGYTGPGGAILVPSNFAGSPVRTLGSGTETAPIFSPFGSSNTSVTSLVIPDGITAISSYAFVRCTQLASATIAGSVTNVGNNAFQNCSKLSSITIPDSVALIGNSAFYECAALTNVTIGTGVARIGDNAFIRCTSLTSLNLGSGTVIANWAFQGCAGLTNVTIPGNVQHIGESAFRDCTGLTNITLGNGIKRIDWSAFGNCTKLGGVTIPSSVTAINYAAFNGCTELTNIAVDASNAEFSSVDGVLFNKYATTLRIYPHGKQGGYFIPNTVTTIGGWAFQGSTKLTSVTIPNSVTTIESSAFRDCTGLTTVTIPSSVTVTDGGLFVGCSGLTSVYCQGNKPVQRSGGPHFAGISTTGTVYYPAGASGWGSSFGDWPTQVYGYQPPTANVVLTVEKSTNLSGQWQFDREINVGPMTNTNEFYRLKIGTLVQ